MTDFFDNNALLYNNTAIPNLLAVPYIDAETLQVTYPSFTEMDVETNRSPWLAVSPVDGKKLRNFEFAYWKMMMLAVVWGDRFGRDNGLIPISGTAREGVTGGNFVAEGVV